MTSLLRRLIDLLCHPATAAASLLVGLAALYLVEKVPANMPFVVAVIATLAAIAYLLSRKPYFSLYVGLGTTLLITVASTVKYRLKGFDLHVFDFGFTGGDSKAMGFLWSSYGMVIGPILAFAVMAIAILAAVALIEKRWGPGMVARSLLLLAAAPALYLSYPLKSDQPRYFHYLGGYNASAFFVSLLDIKYLFQNDEFTQRMRDIPAQQPYTTALDCGDPAKLPDIFLVLSESHTDPANFPQLKRRDVFNQNFRSDDGKLHPLYVETFGGGTWVTSISLLTGLSSALFGVQAPYLTTVLEGKVHGALPEVLARCGYRTVEVTPVPRTFVNEGPFMESIGFQEIFDYSQIGATQYAHRDQFYFDAAAKILEEHRKSGGGPLLLSMKTMFAHSPYFEPLVAENGLPHTDFAAADEVDEYVNRMHAGQRDFAQYLKQIQSLTSERGSVVLEFGDHQSFVTKSFADEQAGGNSLIDLRSVAYRTYYSLHAFGYKLEDKAIPAQPVDIGFLGAVLVEAAKLPQSPMYKDLIALNHQCLGRYRDCRDLGAVDRFLRKRVDSGLLDVMPGENPEPRTKFVAQHQ